MVDQQHRAGKAGAECNHDGTDAGKVDREPRHFPLHDGRTRGLTLMFRRSGTRAKTRRGSAGEMALGREVRWLQDALGARRLAILRRRALVAPCGGESLALP